MLVLRFLLFLGLISVAVSVAVYLFTGDRRDHSSLIAGSDGSSIFLNVYKKYTKRVSEHA